MATTTAHFSASYSPITARTTAANKPLYLPSFVRTKHVKNAPFCIQKTARLSISAAAGTAVEVDGAAAASKAAKSLPFRVGHGFDLHRLEPGYPLIIGGIDVLHERGCEAHSDEHLDLGYGLLEGWYSGLELCVASMYLVGMGARKAASPSKIV